MRDDASGSAASWWGHHRWSHYWWSHYWHLVILGCWTLAWFLDWSPHGGMAWHFFTTGSSLLFDGAPDRHGLRHLGPHQGVLVTEVVLTTAGLYLVHAVMQIALIVRPELSQRPLALRVTFLAGEAVFLVAWAELAVTFAHLDDVAARPPARWP